MTRTFAPLLLLLAAAAPSASAQGDADERTRLLREITSEAESVRDRASVRLESADGLSAEELRTALRTAPPRARPAILRLAAAREMKDLVPDIAALATTADAVTTEAATRALVALGAEGVAAGRAAIGAAPTLSEAERATRLRHLDALDAQSTVERAFLSRWRRKGGSYRGRYVSLEKLGYPVQPVLLAMLLDIPLEDHFVIVPSTGDEEADRALRQIALRELASSRRRGYRTFAPLPPTVEIDDLFFLSAQALGDVADMALVGGILEEVHSELLETHRRAVRWRPRQWEDAYAHEIEVTLAARGSPELLDQRREAVEVEVEGVKRAVRGTNPQESAELFHFYATKLSELAGVLHQRGRFDDAAKKYDDVLRIQRMLTGKDSAIAAYNRACALARGGRKDEALTALARALDTSRASGWEDLTREWVTEDGDLATLRDDPRFEEALKKRFGE